jgi:hypothetical protein
MLDDPWLEWRGGDDRPDAVEAARATTPPIEDGAEDGAEHGRGDWEAPDDCWSGA